MPSDLHNGNTAKNSERLYTGVESNGQAIIPIEELIQRLEKVYVHFEQLAVKEASRFSDSGKASLRRAQGQLQKVRLLLYHLKDKR